MVTPHNNKVPATITGIKVTDREIRDMDKQITVMDQVVKLTGKVVKVSGKVVKVMEIHSQENGVPPIRDSLMTARYRVLASFRFFVKFKTKCVAMF